MSTQSIHGFPPVFLPPLAIDEGGEIVSEIRDVCYILGPNDGGIKRGDREDTGDNAARPDEMGTGPAHPTADPTGFGGASLIRHPETNQFDPEEELLDQDGMEVMEATDGRLGLTDIGNKPADDWAADTGPTRSPADQKKR